MTPTQQTLRNLINEKCPELLELRFGCEVKVIFDTGSPLPVHKILGRNDSRTICTETYGELNEQDIKILGTPPDLSHLLRAIGNSVAVDADGDFWDNKGKVHDLYYDLFKSPLDQDEPTLLALIELIK